jgi:MoaA/NifB/PqqE/SkfB family radical SAM enzyme
VPSGAEDPRKVTSEKSRSNGPSELEPGGGASGLAGWRIARVTGAIPTSASFWLERNDGSAKIQIMVRQRGEGMCLQQTPLGDVSYRRASGLNEREAAQLTRGFAKLLVRGAVPIARYFPHLSGEAKLDDDGARLRLAQVMEGAIPLLGDDRGGFGSLAELPTPTELIFDPPGIAEFLTPEVEVDGPALFGWVFRGIYMPSTARRQRMDFTAYVLEFARDDREQTARLTLRVDGDETKSFARCGRLSLDVAHDGEIDEVPAEVSSLASWVAALLRLRSSSALRIQVPESLEELRAASYPPRSETLETSVETDADGAVTAVAEASGPPPALNIALDPDCGQRCVFCSVKSYVTPRDAGEVDVEEVCKQLEQAQRLGVREVRLNGIDPLRHSRVLEVLEAILAAGFPMLTVFSPGRRLADDGFRRAFLQRVPSRLTVSIPLYGRTAETHDTVTGSPGSHREVLRAIDGLRADGAGDSVRISTILTKQNVHEIVPMLRWVREMGFGDRVGAHLPYPMRSTTRDPYSDSAMRESELLARLSAELEPLSEDERAYVLPIVAGAFRHPCVAWQAERDRGVPALGAAFPEVALPLAGTEYRSADFVHASGTADEGEAFAVAVVDCPHAAACALAPVCPREHYSVYAQLYGLGEFAPVRPSDLYEARPLGHRRSGDGRGAAANRSRGSSNGGVWSTARAAWRSIQRGDSEAK